MRKKMLSLLTAGALAVSLAPSFAFATQQELNAANPSASMAQDATQLAPQASKAALTKKTKTMRAKYKAVIKNAIRGLGSFSKVYNKSRSNWYVYNYCVYDIDKNGTPELFVNAGTCAADTVWYTFTMKSGKARCIGKLGDGYTYLCSGTNKAVYGPSFHMGAGRVHLGKISGGKLVKKVGVTDTDELGGWPKLQKYTKKHKTKALQRGNVGSNPDYTLINKAKVTK